MKSVRFIMVGGFLGAGKTTTLSRLAQHYQERGLRVGVITNDQADNLVDTHNFRTQGLAAAEIPGGCFCCRFDALTAAAGRLAEAERPDVLLAEPVGSCTDLVATVVQPLKRLYADRYEVAPYPVLLDPVRARKILTGERLGGFSPKVAYIFHKQLEEADALVVNKADTLSAADRDDLKALLRHHYPEKEVLFLSARTGEGLDALRALIERSGAFGRNIPAVDYDTYAEGEAELGWLNATARLVAPAPFDGDAFLLELARSIQSALAATGGEVAHLKMLLHAGGRTAIANLTRGDAAPELSQPAGISAAEADLIVNARVHLEPDDLWRIVENCLAAACQRSQLRTPSVHVQRFKPGRPVPTHRYAEAL
jgi:Ni2+-binding GTPase involved in maturation of urease and hydrogenase